MSSLDEKGLEAAARLRECLDDYDREVAWQLENGGERADLWNEIDVNIEDLRAVLDVLAKLAATRARGRVAADRDGSR